MLTTHKKGHTKAQAKKALLEYWGKEYNVIIYSIEPHGQIKEDFIWYNLYKIRYDAVDLTTGEVVQY